MNKPLDDQYFSLNLAATLTGQQQAEIAALQAMPDEAIDYSDIPPLTEEFWQNAVRSPYCYRSHAPRGNESRNAPALPRP